jgi:hypothetical protein
VPEQSTGAQQATCSTCSAFLKLKNLYDKILPIFDSYGFRPPSAGVVARDLSAKIEAREILRNSCATIKSRRFIELAALYLADFLASSS